MYKRNSEILISVTLFQNILIKDEDTLINWILWLVFDNNLLDIDIDMNFISHFVSVKKHLKYHVQTLLGHKTQNSIYIVK